MDECWRCASKLIAGSRFCPGCGAAIGSAPGVSSGSPAAKPPSVLEREPADPMAATAPADAAHLAALRRGGPPPTKERDEDTPPPKTAPPKTAPPKTKGRTVPMKAAHLMPPPGQPAPAPAQPAPAQPARRVAKTQADEPTMPSHGEQPRISPKAASTMGGPIPLPVPPSHAAAPQGFHAFSAPTQPPYSAPPPQPAYGAPAQPAHSPWAAPVPPAPPAPPAVGARVLVDWGDGNRYPATVQQCAPGQCLVLFPDGQQRWVDVRRVTVA